MKTQDWKCYKCDASGGVVKLGRTQVQIISEVIRDHAKQSPHCGSLGAILLNEEKPETPETKPSIEKQKAKLDHQFKFQKDHGE